MLHKFTGFCLISALYHRNAKYNLPALFRAVALGDIQAIELRRAAVDEPGVNLIIEILGADMNYGAPAS